MLFKHPCYLFSDLDGEPMLAGSRWGRVAMVVLARHLCVHFSLDVRGVPARRTQAFVSLNAARHVPFAESDGAYVRQGETVQVWAWPRALREKASRIAGLDAVVLPESLLEPVKADGVVFRDCVAGVEALRFEQGLLRDSAWWAVSPTTQDRARWAGEDTAVVISPSALASGAPVRVWARGWRPLPGARSAPQVRARFLLVREQGVVILGWGALSVAAASLGWTYGEARALKSEVALSQQAMERALLRAQAVDASRSALQGDGRSLDERWVDAARSASRSFDVLLAWAAIAPQLVKAGLLVREFTFERDLVRLTLVSGYETEVDLISAVTALESSGLWSNVELIDLSNPLAVRLSARPSEAMFGPVPR